MVKCKADLSTKIVLCGIAEVFKKSSKFDGLLV